jgi:ABC-type transporter MlaC component
MMEKSLGDGSKAANTSSIASLVHIYGTYLQQRYGKATINISSALID